MKSEHGKGRDIEFFENYFFVKPFRWAFFSSVFYFVVCVAYIWISGNVVKNIAANTENFYSLEIIKGVVFVFVTSVLIFLLLYILFKRLAHQHEEIMAQKNELLISQRQAMAGIFASSVAHDINNVLTILDYHWYLLTQINKDVKIDDEVREKFGEAIKDLQILSQRLMNTGKENLPSELELFRFCQADQANDWIFKKIQGSESLQH
ncbi:MAG: hypothetical protein U5R06_19660 [candidate division KSB1 bacterium]|nr:hypothetical protein [candidate division KSB1 bacterium]